MTVAVLPSAAPAAPVARPRLVVIGAAFASAGSLVFFAATLGMYLDQRASALEHGTQWIPKEITIPLSQPTMMLFTLLLSSVTAQWAVDAIRKDDRTNAYVAFGITFMFGLAFLNMAAYLNSILGIDAAAAGKFAILYYTVTGAHLVMVVAAMVFLALMAFRALGGQYTSRQHDGVSAAALFWHATVVVYAICWYAIYVTK